MTAWRSKHSERSERDKGEVDEHGTFIFDCVDCIIDQSNDGHYGGLWGKEEGDKF